jgi:type II secretion system protein N
VGYGFFYLFVFFLGCYLSFPYARLKDRLIAEFAAEQKGKLTSQKLEIDELEPYWFTGVRARGVRLSIANTPKIGEPDAGPTVIEYEELRARVSILAKIFGKTKVSFYARAFGGEFEGTFSDSATERHLDFEMHDIAVGRLTPLTDLVGLPMYGSLRGKVDLTFPEKRASKAEGSLNLAISDLAVGDGNAKIKGTLALPKIQVGELAMEADVKEGLVRVNKLGAAGKDLEFAADGTIKLKDQPTESVSDIYLRFKLSDAYRTRNDVTKSLFGAPNSTAPALFELADARIKQSKRPDGFYGWHMMGLVNAGRFEPYSGTPPTNRLTPPASPTSAVRGFTK